MPCYDPRGNEPQIKYVDNPETLETNRMLVAIICAILTELERNGIAENIITEAERNGEVKIQEMWNLHKQEDKERLGKLIEGLSDHEKSVLRNLL